MKDLNEYKIEIFRRSEQKRQRRKQIRARILACCIPLAICTVIISAWGSLPDSVSKDAAPEVEQFTEMLVPEDGCSTGSTAQIYSAQVFRGDSDSTLLFNQEQIQNLLDTIEEYCEAKGCAPEDDDEIFTGATLSPEFDTDTMHPNYAMGGLTDQTKTNYIIRFTDPSGNETVYTLKEYQLTNTQNGQTVILDAYHLNSLQELLDSLISQK